MFTIAVYNNFHKVTLAYCSIRYKQNETMQFLKYLTAWFQIRRTITSPCKDNIKPRRSARKCSISFFNKKSLSAIWQFTSVSFFRVRNFWQKFSRLNSAELIFLIGQQINHFFRLCLVVWSKFKKPKIGVWIFLMVRYDHDVGTFNLYCVLHK